MLSVVLPTRDKDSRLRLTLRALVDAAAECPFPVEVGVVDDGSTDATPQVVDEARQGAAVPLRGVRRRRPQGRAAARNTGFRHSVGGRLLFVDDDVLVDAPLLAAHHAAPGERGDGGPVVARGTILHLPWLRSVADLERPDAALPPRLLERVRQLTEGAARPAALRPLARRTPFEADLHRLLAARRHQVTGRWPAATGGNLSIDRALFARLGGFDPAMGLRWGVEDLELGLRAERAGALIVHLPEATAIHLDHPIAGRDEDQRSNLDYFASKHGPALGRRLADYFAGAARLEDVVA